MADQTRPLTHQFLVRRAYDHIYRISHGKVGGMPERFPASAASGAGGRRYQQGRRGLKRRGLKEPPRHRGAARGVAATAVASRNALDIAVAGNEQQRFRWPAPRHNQPRRQLER